MKELKYYSLLYYTMATTIQISEKLQQELNKRKFSDRESYEEVIWNLMEDIMELNEETRNEIKISRSEVKTGKYHTLTETKKKLGF